MLRYILILCVISSYVTAQSRVGTYIQLVMTQHSPISSFMLPLRGANTSSEEYITYFTDHWMIMNPNLWVIRGVWPTDLRSRYLKNCVNSLGAPLVYNHDLLNDLLTENLFRKWPVLRFNQLERDLWETEYNTHGSCMTADVAEYFQKSMQMLDSYNIGVILGRSRIRPGGKYSLDRIVEVITSFVRGHQVYVKCIPAENPEEQYLLQVQLCFNSIQRLTDCRHRYRHPDGEHDCDSEKKIICAGNP